MDALFEKTLKELLSVKECSIVEYLDLFTLNQRNEFLKRHTDLVRHKRYFSQFVEADRIDLLMPVMSSDPVAFLPRLTDYDLKVPIPTKPTNLWGETTRRRVMQEFHYQYPHLVNFANGADVSAWIKGAPKYKPAYDDFMYVVSKVIPSLTKSTASYGPRVRTALAKEYLPRYTADDFDHLLSDGDTLLNELFSEEKFKEYIKAGLYPKQEFVETLEMNCTISAMTKNRTGRHGKRVAKNLKRAKLLLEVKDVC